MPFAIQNQTVSGFPTFEEMLAQAARAAPQSSVVLQPSPPVMQPVPQVRPVPPQQVAATDVSDAPPPFEPRFTKVQFGRMTKAQQDQVASVEEPRYRSYQQAVQQWRFNQQAQKLATMQKNRENVQGFPAIGNQLRDVAEQLKEYDPVKLDKDSADLQKLFARAADIVQVDRQGAFLPRYDVIGNTSKLPMAITKADELNDRKDKLKADLAKRTALLKDQSFLEGQANRLDFHSFPGGFTNSAAGNAFMFQQPSATNGSTSSTTPLSIELANMIMMLRKQNVPEAEIKAFQERWVK